MALQTFDFETPITDLDEKIVALRHDPNLSPDQAAALPEMEARLERLRHEIYGNLTVWQRVQLARHPARPHTLDYLRLIFTDWTELHGDRTFGDDHACIAGFATLEGRPVAVIGQQKGSGLKENVYYNYGSMHPEGYRKALRVMKLAEKFGRPVLTFIDTGGAYPGVGAEERGQAEAIARNLMEMSLLRTPILATVIGEGGSGGALGIGVADRLMMQENAFYSLISPEGCASILWRDGKFAPTAAEALKISARDLQGLGIVEEIVGEPLGGAHRNPAAAAAELRGALVRGLGELTSLELDILLEARFQKFRRIGVFFENDPKIAGIV